MKRQRLLQGMKSKYRETSVALTKVITERAAMADSCIDEMRRMQQSEREHFVSMYMKASAALTWKEAKAEFCINEIKSIEQDQREHFAKVSSQLEKITQELEAKSKNLEQLEQELQQRQLRNENARIRIRLERKMTEKATLEQNKADDNVLKLAEQQKKEQDELHKKITELGRKLDAKQPLELELKCLKGTLQGMKHMGEDEDLKVKKRMDALEEKMKKTEYELADLEKLNQKLLVKVRKSNDEVQDARKEVISYLRETTAPGAFIGVKRMGELDRKPFLKEAKRKFRPGEADEKAVELCSLWEECLRDPSWHPFKVTTDGDGNSEYIIDEEDEKVKELQSEYGDEVCSAVITALRERSEYSGSGRHIIPELWNFKAQRKAMLKEGVEYILRQWKVHEERWHLQR